MGQIDTFITTAIKDGSSDIGKVGWRDVGKGERSLVSESLSE
jgi:hypothetical protein